MIVAYTRPHVDERRAAACVTGPDGTPACPSTSLRDDYSTLHWLSSDEPRKTCPSAWSSPEQSPQRSGELGV
jgi:hypothetical protein